MIAGSSSNLATPATPTVTLRTAGSNETTVGTNTYYKVVVTATNFFGETVQRRRLDRRHHVRSGRGRDHRAC